MFDKLSTAELTTLQSVLFEGTEDAYEVASLKRADTGWFGTYRPVHREVGTLFIEVGTELLKRLDAGDKAA
jgi:hypothetical protein